MTKELIVRFVPTSIQESDTIGRCVVMADILRASSTIIQALANGAAAIYPQAEIEDSRRLASELGAKTLIGGERNGQIVAGFDCGNSPLEYTTEKVSDRKVVLCTTNGTFTLSLCRNADRVLIGAFTNISAICERLQTHESAMIACAGTNRMVTDEDVLFAGAVASKLVLQNPSVKLDDAAKIAADRWQSINSQLSEGFPLWEWFAQSHGGRNLVKLNYEDDIQYCSQIDLLDLVPELDIASWVIKPSSQSVNVVSPTSQKTP